MDIPGYALTELVCEDADLALYQATRLVDSQPVLLRIPTSARPTPALLRRLEREHELARDLDPDRIARPLALEHHTGAEVLVLAQGPTQTLTDLLGSPMDVQSFLRIAIGITAALAELHRHELVHKDIKPEHVLLDTAGHVWLTGLGIASRLPRERRGPEPPEVIAGTLAYMAPEQTGRMNRSIDSRSDLYALGITFYQMLTGVLPFNASDPMEWVHCHIARQPVPPIQRVSGLPELLSEMVMKLMAKTGEERYQSAAGLGADLRRCLEEWESNAHIDPFLLGAHDLSDRLLIPEKLYGRKPEIDALIAAFDRVASGAEPELVLVSGYSGIGKSAVVNELHKTLVPPRALFVGGKSDPYKRDIPYATLAQALQALLRQVLGESEEGIVAWREAVQEALGPNGRLVTDLVPDLVALIGEQPPVQEVPPQDAQNRFNTVFRRLLDVFARPGHPLVLFLDDLQWLDTATVQLLEELLIHPAVKHILLIGAYRDNEVGPTHPLMLALDSMRKGGAAVHSIVLGPLSKEDVVRLTADAFHCEEERAEPLARLVHEKTGGNPFFAIQFFTALAEEGLVAFDVRTARWQWDLNRIHAKGFTDNVADLMVGKLSRLQAEAREGLKQLACLGSEARTATLAQVQGVPKEEVEESLQEAIQAGLLLRREDSVSFLHDRVHEAAYALIPDGERPAVHLSIGRKLRSQAGPEELDDTLFDVVNHLNRGVDLMTDPAERERLAELNAAAGRRARSSIAYVTARDFFAVAATLSPEETWDTRYEFRFALLLDWAETEYLRGAFEEAERLFDLLLAEAKNDLDKAAVYELRLKAYQVAGDWDEAVAMGLEALQLLGVGLPQDDEALDRETQAEAAAVQVNLQGREIAELADAPEATDPRAKAVIGLLSGLAPTTYASSRPQLFPLIILKLVNRSLVDGPTKESCHGYSAYGFLLGALFDDPHSGCAFSEMSIELSERFGDLSLRGAVLFVHGNHNNFWIHPIATDFVFLERAFAACLDGGNHAFAGFVCFNIVWQAIERGDSLGDVLRSSRRFAAFALGCRNDAVHQTIVLEQQLLKCLMGETDGSASFSGEGISELSCVEKIDKTGFTCGITYYHTMKTMAAYLMGDDAASRAHAEEAKRVLAAVMAMPMEVTFYFLHALVLIRTCREANKADRTEILESVAAYQKRLAFWAESCPANFASRHALVSAEIAETEGDELSAERLFEQAIESARANGFIHWEAMANEAAARFYESRGLKTASRAHLREARQCYARWGADAKIEQLDALQPWLAEEASARGDAIASRTEHLDTMAIIKAQSAISSEISLDSLLESLMRIVLENAGARQGCLLLARKEELTLAASAQIEGQNVVMRVCGGAGLPQTGLPASIVNYVRRTRARVLLDDVISENPYSADEYFSRRRPKSLLCFPITRRSEVIGLLYLENDLATHAFTPDSLAVLELLAAQAAISLENALGYEALRQSEARLEKAQRIAKLGNWEWDIPNNRLWWSEETFRIFGLNREEFGETFEAFIDAVHPDDRERVQTSIQHALQHDSGAWQIDYRTARAAGAVRHVHEEAETVFDGDGRPLKRTGTVQDITERKQLEEQLLQAQKMEAVGQLAGGVAHDFNNMLSVILGHAELIKSSLPEEHILRSNVLEIEKAGIHSRDVTRQLLAFSRKQIIAPETTDLNRLIEASTNTVAKLIGETIELRFSSGEGLWKVRVDPSQMDQILINLAVNARDAMHEGGVLTIETMNAHLDEADCSQHVDCRPGDYVLLAVSDDGAGMDEETLGRIFEPFFTTKESGRGTGLGLATVYGIVKQNGGFIDVCSRPARGTTFKIFVPRLTEAADAKGEAEDVKMAFRPGTVLLIEDDDMVRGMTAALLEKIGYSVVTRESPLEALAFCEEEQAHVDLLMTDVVMPQMSGIELADRLRETRPGLRVLYMSGYTEDVVAGHGVLKEGVHFLQKPFRMNDLALKVRHALEDR